MKVGEKKVVTIPPEEAYGVYQSDLVVTYSTKEFEQLFPGTEDLSIGQELFYESKTGYRGVLTIKNLGDGFVTIDLNPSLAGKELIFAIELVSLEKAK